MGLRKDLLVPLQHPTDWSPVKAMQFKKGKSASTKDTKVAQNPQRESMMASTSSPSETNPTTSSSKEKDNQTKADILSRVPVGWSVNMSEGDRLHYGRSLYISKGRLKDNLQLWWHPPQPPATGKPSVAQYFSKRLFLWMPRRMFRFDFLCPNCRISLRSKGIYNRVRLVLDVSDFYYLAAEYMDCKQCHATFIAYDDRMMSQLTDATRASFPALLTRKYACDRSIVGLLRARTLGNSSTAMQHNILEQHSEEWLRKQLQYLSACKHHRNILKSLNLPSPQYETTDEFRSFPGAQWFLACYVRDVWARMEMLKAAMTSVYGSIMKIDSTKKVCKKLQGAAANSAQWCTNVGNERGEILLSVLTTSESTSSLQDLADGLISRYETAGQVPPAVLYTDRDCCKAGGDSKFKVLFSKWSDLQIRLDIFHFMRRLAVGCTTESHPLYGVFMSRLSSAIFEWDSDDLSKLQDAKLKEMKMAGIPNPGVSAVQKAISKEELERHCKRQTRSTHNITEGIESLILSLSGTTDTLGVPLFKEEMKEIWNEQKKHVACLQDVPGVQLYTKTGSMRKGGETLPTYRCGRGTTSVESFHLHLARLIPGTSANAVNFQAFLLDGVFRWNIARVSGPSESPLRTFDLRLMTQVNALSQDIHGDEIIHQPTYLAKYTGELIGVEYLFKQSGLVLPEEEDALAAEIDEGFDDEDPILDFGIADGALEQPRLPIPDPPFCDVTEKEDTMQLKDFPMDDSANEDASGNSADAEDEDGSTDSRGIPGWEKVSKLAQALLDVKGISLTSSDACRLTALYHELTDFDKQPLTYRLKLKTSRGRFARSKHGFVGAEVVKRCFLSGGSPATSPNKSRVVEALCVLLCDKIPQPQRDGEYVSRWRLILSEYNKVRQRLLNSEDLLEGTDLVLFHINEATLTKWYKDKTRRDEVKMLLQGHHLPPSRVLAPQPLPAAKDGPPQPEPPINPHQFLEPEDRTGMANVRGINRPSTSQDSNSCSSRPEDTPGPSTSIKLITVPRTTEWRKRKAAALAQAQSGESGGSGGAPVEIPRKSYSCRVCGETMSGTGHTQFRGKRYCPNVPGQISKEEWLAQRREEAEKAKKK